MPCIYFVKAAYIPLFAFLTLSSFFFFWLSFVWWNFRHRSNTFRILAMFIVSPWHCFAWVRLLLLCLCSVLFQSHWLRYRGLSAHKNDDFPHNKRKDSLFLNKILICIYNRYLHKLMHVACLYRHRSKGIFHNFAESSSSAAAENARLGADQHFTSLKSSISKIKVADAYEFVYCCM